MSAAVRSGHTAGPVDPRLWSRTRATRRHLVGLSVLGSAAAALVVAQAWLLSRVLDRVITGAGSGAGVGAAVAAVPGLLAVFAGRALLAGVQPLLATRASGAVKAELRRELITARIRQGDAGADTSAMVITATDGLDALDGYFSRYLPSLVLAVTVPLVVGVAVLSADWLSALIMALTLPLIPVFMILVGWTTQDLTRRRWRTQSRLAHHFADLVAGLPTLQVFGRARAQAEGLRRSEAAQQRESLGVLRIAFLSALVLELLATLSVAVVAVVVGLRLIDGGLDLGTALFVLLLAPEAFWPLRQVGTHFHDSADGVAAAEKAFAVIDAPAVRPSQSTSGQGRALDLCDRTVTVEQVTVHSGERLRLAPLDLAVRPGELVALTGPSGGGKSTALAVLAGLVTPTSGRVQVGDVELSDLDDDGWRAQIGWVGQQPGLISGTVADNLALGDRQASTERQRRALELVGGGDIGTEQTVVAGSEGLSAGQRRRVALARALLRVGAVGSGLDQEDRDHARRGLLLLDEPTAGLDAEVELTAIDAVRAAGVSAVVVSHRPAVLAAADRIVRVGG